MRATLRGKSFLVPDLLGRVSEPKVENINIDSKNLQVGAQFRLSGLSDGFHHAKCLQFPDTWSATGTFTLIDIHIPGPLYFQTESVLTGIQFSSSVFKSFSWAVLWKTEAEFC